MIDILDLMRPLAILATILILYIHLYHRYVPRRIGIYMNPDWNYMFKYWLAKRKLNELKKIQRKRLNEKLFKKSLNERPLVLKNDKSSDSLLFFGSDQNGNSVLLRMTRLRHRQVDLWIVIRTKRGQFILPQHPIVRMYEATSGKFRVGGLEFQCLDSFSKWRLTYNGYLRNCIQNELDPSKFEDNLVFVKFNFFFTASNKPFFYPVDWSSNLMATGFATENWKYGNWSNALNIPGNGGYDQFGEMFGQISLPHRIVLDLRLPGIRQRRWESVQDLNLRRFVSTIGVTTTGCVFNIGACSFNQDLSHVQFGCVRLATGHVHAIDWTDFKIPHFSDQSNSIPNQYTIHFRAGNYNFKAFIYLNHEQQIHFLQGDQLSWKIRSMPIHFDLNADCGFGATTIWFPNEHPQELIPTIPKRCIKLIFGHSLPSDTQFTLKFNDYEASSKNISGGKGASLALLTVASRESDIGFTVPNGFIVSTSALRNFLNENSEIFLKLRNLEDICYNKIAGDLEVCCESVEKLFEKFKLNDDLIKSLHVSFNDLISSDSVNQKYAVRSSGADEDGAEFSGAGQNKSYLGLKNFNEILHAIVQCWASMYSYRSVQYRRNLAQPIISEMAVVVQIMVPSESSGVMFTNHSVSENSPNILITANYGLGESVVSGYTSPDTYILSRNYDSTKLKIEEIIVGAKNHLIMMKRNGDSGTEIIENKHDIMETVCLTEDLILRLGHIAVTLENMFGVPQDIEWSINENQIYLLQSRPISIFKNFSDWEYLHEMDSPLMASKEMLSRGNVGEVLGCPIDHFTQTSLVKSLDCYAERFHGIDKYANMVPNVHFKISQHFVFLDILQMLRNSFKNKQLNDFERMSLCTILASLDFTPEIQKAIIDRGGQQRLSHIWKLNKKIFSEIWSSKSIERTFTNFMKTFKSIYNMQRLQNYESALEAFDDLEIILEDHLSFVLDAHVRLSSANVYYEILVMMMLYEKDTNFSNEHIKDLMKVMNCNDIISLNIPKRINELSNSLYLFDDWKIFLKVDPLNGVEWLRANAPICYQKFQQFITDYGHRCLNEFVFSSKTWEMQPEIIIQMIQNNLSQTLSGNGWSTTASEQNADEVIASLQTPKSRIRKFILKKMIPYGRQSVQRREYSKHLAIDFVNIVRKYLIHLSQMLHNEGLLPEPKLIFYFQRTELRKLVKNREIRYVLEAIRRRKLFKEWNNFRFPDFVIGSPRPINKISKNIQFSKAFQKITGVPVQHGLVKGRACVLKDISEVHKLKSGDILITHSTDIGWSPYFPILGGLITELGGLVSHGAIIAREYGLPCIVGVKYATDIFQFGDEIILDGNIGFVTKAE